MFKQYLAQLEHAYQAGNATEHTYRPALKTVLEAFRDGIVATNEPKRIQCGAPDYIVTRENIPLGFIEAKDIGVDLDSKSLDEQLGRYRNSLANLIITDYLEFRWYVGGTLRLSARLARPSARGAWRADPEGVAQLTALLQAFFDESIPVLASPKELAERMAAMAQLMRDIIGQTLGAESVHGALHEQMDAFRQVLLHDLTAAQFADMHAQTICYGLFAARCNSAQPHFSRMHAAYDLPKTNPFLCKLFGHIAGPELDDRIVWVVDNLAELLNRADIAAILQDFGHKTRQEDSVVHFYETFLGAYDPAMREARGVYYTPAPVVSYIVRSVDALLKSEFKLSDGLADARKIKLTRPKKSGPGTETIETHQVQILDPATGTGTFLHGVIRQIYASFADNQGLWPGYVRENLLPRLYGFELLMAPYAVAHMKLGLLLRETGYDFSSEQRLRVFLTNTLEEAQALTSLPLFTQWLAEEADSANQIKSEAPVMVVLGNPPYSGHSANSGAWIADLLRGRGQKTGNYFAVDGAPLGERNPKWLNDDYVKFIRFAQWRIEQTGHGVLAFVTNHGYLDNPTFRGMRQSLLHSFDDIYLLDLHGNSKRKEKAADGSKDENVFDIQQGVAIGIFVKRATSPGKAKAAAQPCAVHHADLYGTRAHKYAVLADSDLTQTLWKNLEPQAPFYLFVPQDETLRAEYEQGWKITEAMPVNGWGIATRKDYLLVNFERDVLVRRFKDIRILETSAAIQKYDIKESPHWCFSKAVKQMSHDTESHVRPILFRPFDTRYVYYEKCMIERGDHRFDLMSHMSPPNLSLITVRRMESAGEFRHCYCTDKISVLHSTSAKEGNFVFPIYLYPATANGFFDDSTASRRQPNLAPAFITDFSARLQLTFVPDGCGDLHKTFGPEDVFYYAYAVFYSPGYRARYVQFLKIDFPRLPLTRDAALFRTLCGLGRELVALHLMTEVPKSEARYPVAGDNVVDTVRYSEPANGSPGRVSINATQYFDRVPLEVWRFHIGGYQVCQKWLKDRKGRALSYTDLKHYASIVAALARTLELQSAIDSALGQWPLSAKK